MKNFMKDVYNFFVKLMREVISMRILLSEVPEKRGAGGCRLCTFYGSEKTFCGIPWTEWAEDIRLRWKNALDYYREELYFDIEFQEYMQFKFYEQWMKLKAYAN